MNEHEQETFARQHILIEDNRNNKLSEKAKHLLYSGRIDEAWEQDKKDWEEEKNKMATAILVDVIKNTRYSDLPKIEWNRAADEL